jgi:AraC family transcriptional regulator
MKKLIFFILSSVLVFAATVYYRLGAYKGVDIEVKKMDSLYYHKINDDILEVESWAHAHNLNCAKTFGEYLDDPRKVEERRLRSNGGCVLDNPLIGNSPYLYKKTEANRYIIAHFTGAPSIGPFKVYPKVEEFMLKKHIPMPAAVIEIYNIYDNEHSLTDYLFEWPE